MQPVEHDAVLLAQPAAVISLQGWLGRRQDRPLGVVDQIQHQPRARLAVAEPIELLQAGDAAGEHAAPPLPVDVVLEVTGQRSHHRHTLLG